MAQSPEFDIVIVGAGPNGLIMGKTFLEVNPDTRMLLLDETSTVGGTWSKDRLYPGLKSNNLEGGYEFSDFPMRGQEKYGLKFDQHIPGPINNQYMQDFADHFDLTRRTRLRCKAHAVEQLADDTWIVRFLENGKDRQVHTRKLVLATGLTVRPFLPHFEGQDTFGCPISHIKNPAVHGELLSHVKSVVLLNATKSAFDVAYACATKGIQVHWVIRKSGHGPCWMSPARVTPLKKRLEDVGRVRFISWLSPCIWSEHEGYGLFRGFLQNTRLGRRLSAAIWKIINQDVVTLSRYDEHPETAKLKPRGDIVWYACTLGIWNYDEDFLSYVRNGTIKIYDDDITHLSPHTVHLASSTTLSTDALICSTGWDHRPALTFNPPHLAASLGLPTPSSSPHASHSPLSSSLLKRATDHITTSLPFLSNRPVINPNYKLLRSKPTTTTDSITNNTPTPDDRDEAYRLYRFLAPPTHVSPTNPSPSIAFLGFTWAIPTLMLAQVAALWITAYFGGRLPQQQPQPFPQTSGTAAPSSPAAATKDQITQQVEKSREEVLWETALHTEFARLRYPGGFGARFPDMAFEAVPYVDMLMGDLELEKKRKLGKGQGRGWWWLGRVWREVWEHYGTEDYKGLVGEWVAKEEGRRKKKLA